MYTQKNLGMGIEYGYWVWVLSFGIVPRHRDSKKKQVLSSSSSVTLERELETWKGKNRVPKLEYELEFEF